MDEILDVPIDQEPKKKLKLSDFDFPDATDAPSAQPPKKTTSKVSSLSDFGFPEEDVKKKDTPVSKSPSQPGASSSASKAPSTKLKSGELQDVIKNVPEMSAEEAATGDNLLDATPKYKTKISRGEQPGLAKFGNAIDPSTAFGDAKPRPKIFNAEGSDYDEETAKRYNLTPDETGHWQSRVELGPQERLQYGLPEGSGIILKGRGHPTFNKTIEGEREAGYQIEKRGDRYFSIPNSAYDPAPKLMKEALAGNPLYAESLKNPKIPLPEYKEQISTSSKQAVSPKVEEQVFDALPDNLKIKAAYKMSAEQNYEASNKVLDLIEDKTGYVDKIKAHNMSMMGDKKGAQQMYVASYQKNPKDLDALLRVATSSVEVGDTKTAAESARQYRTQTGGVAGGSEEKAFGLSYSHSILAGEAKASDDQAATAFHLNRAEYWQKNKEQIALARQEQERANTLKTMPEFLLNSSPISILFAPSNMIGQGISDIHDAFAGEEKIGNTQNMRQLDGWDRLVLGTAGLWKIGLGAGMLTPAGWGAGKGARGVGEGLPSLMQNAQAAPRNARLYESALGFLFPEMMEFNLALEGAKMVVPHDVLKWATAPVSSALEQGGYNQSEYGPVKRELVSMGDMFGLILTSKAAHAVANAAPEITRNAVNKARMYMGKPPVGDGWNYSKEYVDQVKSVYKKIQNHEPLDKGELSIFHDGIQNLTHGELQDAVTLMDVANKTKLTAIQLSEMQDGSPEKSYRLGDKLFKTPEELQGNIEALLKEGVKPEELDVQISNDPASGEKIVKMAQEYKRLAEPPAPEAPKEEPKEATPIFEGEPLFVAETGHEVYRGEKGYKVKGPAGGEIPEFVEVTYKVKDKKGKVMKDDNGNEIIGKRSQRNPAYTKIMKKFAGSENFELDKGKRAFEEGEDPGPMAPKAMAEEVVNRSENPFEIAQEYFWAKDSNPGEKVDADFKDEMIAEVIGRVRGGEKDNSPGSFRHTKASANVTAQMRMNWFSEKGENIDEIANRANSKFGSEEREAGEFITPEDVADFIIKYPGGHAEFEKSKIDPIFQKLRDKFYDLTGMEVDWVENRIRMAEVDKEPISDIDADRAAQSEEWAMNEVEREGITIENIDKFSWLYSEKELQLVKRYLENGRKEEADRPADQDREVSPDDAAQGGAMGGEPKAEGEEPPKEPAEADLGDIGKNERNKSDLLKDFEAKIESIDRKLAEAAAERKAKEKEISDQIFEQNNLFEQGKEAMSPEELEIKASSDRETIRKALEPIDAKIATLQRQRLKMERDRQIVEEADENQGELFSKDSYASTGGPTSGQRPAQPNDGTVKWIEFPDMVRLVKDLLGSNAYVKKLKKAWGVFYPGKGEIGLNPNLFKTENFDQLLKTISHEIGHAADWLPDKLMNRGNILGRIASLVEYGKKTLPFKPGSPGELTKADMDRLRDEAKAMAQDTVIEKKIEEEIVTKTGLTPEDILNVWNAVEKVTNQDFYNFIKGLSTAEKKAVVLQAMKGMVADSLKKFVTEVRTKTGNFVIEKQVIKGDWKSEFKKLVADEIKKRKLWKEAEVYDEAYNLSKKWRPFDETAVSKSHLKYRKSGEEVYADMISVLFNDPGMLQREAPKFFESFFNYLETKPEFKKEYDALQEMLNDPMDNRADAWIREANDAAAEALNRMAEIPKNREKVDNSIGIWRQFMHEFVDWNIEAYSKVINSNAFKAVLSAKHGLKNKLEMLKFQSNFEFLLAQKGNEIVAPLHASGISMDDFNVLLRAEAGLGFRLEKANPLGWQQEYNKQIIDRIKSQYTPDQALVVEACIKKFHETVYDIMTQGYKEGLFTEDTWKIITDNKDSYVTTWLVDKINDRWLSPQLVKATGTLGAAAPAFQATLIKMSAIIRQIEYQRAAKALIDAHKTIDPDNMPDAEVSYSYDIHGKRSATYRVPKGMALLYYHDAGHIKAKVVDRYVAQAVKTYSPNQMMSFVRIMSTFNQGFRPFVTKYNPSFAFYTNIIKDATRSLPNMYAISRSEAKPLQWFTDLLTFPVYHAYKMKSSIQKAKAMERGELTPDIMEMIENGAFDVSIGILNNYDPTISQAGDVLFLKMQSSNSISSALDSFNKKNMIIERVKKVDKWWSTNVGAFELQTKITWYNFLKKRGYSPEAAAFYVRNYAGTPNWANKGTETVNSNQILPFSNVIIQGHRSEFNLATSFKDAPKTALGYWLYAAVHTVVPATMMALAYGGAFGDDIKRYTRGIPKFYLSNYSILPIGYLVEKVSGGAVKSPLYTPVPQEGLQALMNAAVFEIVSTSVDKDGQWDKGVFSNVLKVGSAMTPSYNPLVDVAYGWFDWAVNGVSPRDYRNKKMIPDNMLGAGLKYEWKPMVDFTLGAIGLNLVVTLYNYDKINSRGWEYVISSMPVLGRALKYSRPGAEESLRQLKEDLVNSGKAESLDRKEIIYDYVKKHLNSPMSIDKKVNTYAPQIYRDYYEGKPRPSDPDKAMDAIKRIYKTALVKSIKNDFTEVVAYMESVSNNQWKAELVKKWGESVGIFELKAGVDYMREEGIMSDEVYDLLIDLQKKEQGR